jgi:hypothetical protein
LRYALDLVIEIATAILPLDLSGGKLTGIFGTANEYSSPQEIRYDFQTRNCKV